MQFIRVAVGAQFGADAGIAHGAGDKGQRLQMIHPGFLGGEQAKDQINRLAVDGIVIQQAFHSQENRDDAVKVIKPGMRQGNAMAHAGWPQTFAFLQTVGRGGGVQPIGLRGDFTQFLKKPFLPRQLANDPDSPGA